MPSLKLDALFNRNQVSERVNVNFNVCLFARMELLIFLKIWMNLVALFMCVLFIHVLIYAFIHPSIHPSIHLSFYSLSIYPSIYLSIYLFIYLSITQSIYLYIYPSIYLSFHPSFYLSTYQFIYLSILSIYTSFHLSILYSNPTSISIHPSNHPSNLPTYLPYLPILPTYLSTYLPIYLPIYLPTYLPILPTYLPTYIANNKQPLFYSASTHAQSSELQRQLLDASSSSSHPSSVTYDSCTCCVVKPHATKDKQFGLILDHIIAQVSLSMIVVMMVMIMINYFQCTHLYIFIQGYEVSAMKSIQVIFMVFGHNTLQLNGFWT